MFWEIFRFELRYRILRPATWIYFLVFFVLAFLFMLLLGSDIEGVNFSIGESGKALVNSPYMITGLTTGLGLLGVLIISAIVGNPVYRDFEHNTHALMFTKPVTKAGYLGGRFLGSVVIAILVLVSIPLGFYVAAISPWVEADKFGPNSFLAYAQPFLLFIVPNIIFTGAIFFTTASLTRSMIPNYVGCILIWVLLRVATSLVADLDNQTVAALIDPLGRAAYTDATRYWTLQEKNHLLIPLSGLLLTNRLIWIGVGILVWAVAFFRFKFSYQASDKKNRKQVPVQQQAGDVQEELAAGPATEAKKETARLTLPKVVLDFSSRFRVKQLLRMTRQEFLSVVRNVYFLVIAGAGVGLLFVSAGQIGKIYDTATLPVTYQITDILGGTFGLFMFVIIIFYSGELIWRERGSGVNLLIDAMPVPGSVFYLSKLFALMLVQVLLLVVLMLCGILVQAMLGYFNFEIGLYLKALFGVNLIDWWLMCVLAILVHVLVNNKYLGHFVLVIYYTFSFFMPQLGIEHKMFKFASDTGMFYSDMNGYGHFAWPFFIFKVYWSGFAILLAVLSNLLFVRGTESGFGGRWKQARKRFSRPAKLAATCGFVIFAGSGAYIFYNTNVLNDYGASGETEQAMVEYEKKFSKYKNIPQPKIVDVKLDVDIFPEERDVNISGTMWLKNKSKTPIDSVHVQLSPDVKIKYLRLAEPAKQVLDDRKQGYFIYDLDKPMQPGDSVQLRLDIAYESNGFTNEGGATQVVYNGTFFNSNYLPFIGYTELGELSGEEDRKKHGLPAKERMKSVYDSVNYMTNALTPDADWIRFEATVSTSSGQVAIAPGYLQKEWTENGRNYFHYKMDTPILNFYSFLSARYEIKRDKWKDVNIEIYHHKGHPYNVDRMIRAIKKSLDYYTENFTPYQFRQVRIIEFPRYASFAQSFPNTIPYSESIGFIADVDENDPESIDYPFYVTAHEVAHQWWAHQVIGANVQGSALMIESMAQYSALMVMEKEYGPEKMRKFLKYEMNQYLRGRSSERRNELPMITMEGQQYIHYICAERLYRRRFTQRRPARLPRQNGIPGSAVHAVAGICEIPAQRNARLAAVCDHGPVRKHYALRE
ncbi:MAG: hypothetical protein FD123_267 [Bacteroidetes bacterium]|nr:MAG: hypothetical protein FD123_267 [Bacteroidota bacterium]